MKIESRKLKELIYTFRLPFSDGSYTFFTLQTKGKHKGKYVSEQGVVNTLEQLLKSIDMK